MNFLIAMLIIAMPLISLPWFDPHILRTCLLLVLGSWCWLFWLDNGNKRFWPEGIYPIFITICWALAPTSLGPSVLSLLQTLSLFGLYLFIRDMGARSWIYPAILISLACALVYNFHYTGVHFARMEAGAASYHQANIYAGWLAMVIPVAFAMLIDHWKNMLYWILLFLAMIALWMTGCRSALIGTWAAIFIILAVKLRTRTLAGSVACLITAVIPLFTAFYILYQQPTREPERKSYNRSAIEMANKHPVFGYGPGNFAGYYPAYEEPVIQKINKEVLYLRSAHNLWLQTAAETGWLGLCLLLWLIWYATRNAILADSFMLGILAGLFAFCLDCIFNVTYFYPSGQLMFWLYLGLLGNLETA